MWRFFLTSVEDFTEELVEPVEPVKHYLANKERYVGDMEYKSHEERCANYDLPYDNEYESHVERCAYDVEYKSERKAEEESGVMFSLEETIAYLTSTI